MNSKFQDDPEVEELNWQIEYSRTQLRASGKVALWAIGAFTVLIVIKMLFLDGFPFHPYWDSIGRHLLLVIAVPFLLAIYAVSQFVILWQLRNEFRKALSDLLHDRYGIREKGLPTST